MKTRTLIFSLLLSASPLSHAVTCQLLEGDGGSASGTTKVDAEKAAWNACIDKKMAKRQLTRGDVDVEGAQYDAESCMSAKISCR